MFPELTIKNMVLFIVILLGWLLAVFGWTEAMSADRRAALCGEKLEVVHSLLRAGKISAISEVTE